MEDLLDSYGAKTARESPVLTSIEKASATGSETSKQAARDPAEGLPIITNLRPFSPTRPLSASARTLNNQQFAETNPFILPVGHSTVAFNKKQVHSILRAVSNETLTSSLHQIKNILEEARRVGARSHVETQGHSRQRVKCFRKQSERSEGDD